MAEILSQGEIDALLSALSSGEITPDEVPRKRKTKSKAYDLKDLKSFLKIT